jgi:DNA-binding HxlR family transcriptional regulator
VRGVRTDPSCSIAGALEVIGDRWSILILRDAFRGVRRFDAMQRDLGIARNLLTDRLNKLVSHGVLEKQLYQEHPPRYEYRLTAKGIDLSPALVALMHWGDQWLTDGEPPVRLIHERCGQTLEQVLVCWHCDETVTPLQIRSEKPSEQPA